jgi:hypothetical protein
MERTYGVDLCVSLHPSVFGDVVPSHIAPLPTISLLLFTQLLNLSYLALVAIEHRMGREAVPAVGANDVLVHIKAASFGSYDFNEVRARHTRVCPLLIIANLRVVCGLRVVCASISPTHTVSPCL